MSRRSVDDLVADYLRADGKITKCPAGIGTGEYQQADHRAWKKGLFQPPHLNHPEITDEAFEWPYHLTGGSLGDEEREIPEPIRYRDAKRGIRVVEYFDDEG